MTSLIELVERLEVPVSLLASITVLLVVALASVAGLRAWCQRTERRAWREGGKYVTIEVPPEVDPKSAVLAWRHLLAIEHGRWRRLWFGQPYLIWEYAFTGARLSVRVWVPGGISTNLVIHAVDAAWPGATCTITDAVPPLPEAGAKQSIEGGVFTLARHGAAGLPLVADTGAGDTLRGLVAAGVSHRPSDTAIVQIIACPASRRKARRAAKTTAGPKQGASLAGEALDLFTPGSGGRRSGHYRPTEPAYVIAHRKAVAERFATGTLWTMQVRYAVAVNGPKPVAVAAARDLAAGIAAVLGGAWRRRRSRGAATAVNAWSGGAGVLLSADELAQAAHLPSDAIMPALTRAGARPVAPSSSMHSGGRNTKTLGTAAVGGHKVTLSASDARYHLHVIGKTGSGKSTLLQHLALADIRDRRGLVLIDPAGDLVDDILARLDPETVAERLYLIDPRLDAQPGLAPLAGADEHLVVENLVAICRNIWPRFWGPRADDVLRYGLLTLRENEQPLTMLPNLLLSKNFRRRMVAEIQKVAPAELPASGLLEDGDMTGIPGYWAWYGEMNPTTQNQAAGPVLSRMRALLGRPFIRTMFDASEADFDMADILDNGGIVLARLSKGEVGEDTARLVGSILVAKVWQAATARTAVPERRRRDCSLILDEAQNFLNLPNALDDMLAEARKLHLSVTIAHQYLAQLPKEMSFAVSGQARSKLYFNTSPEDARVLARHTAPLNEHDLAHLDDYTMAARLYIDRREAPAFTLNGLPPAEEIGQADQIRAEALRRIAKTGEPSLASNTVTTAVHPGPFTQRLSLRLARQREAGGDALRDDTRKPSSGHETGEAL